jgi:cysteine-rich secretory family protein
MRKLLVAAALGLSLAALPGVAWAQTSEEQSAEATFVARINDLRASKGLPGLEMHPNLLEKARGWAATMGAAGRIWHSNLADGITANWQKLGENVGVGGSVEGLHNAFVASPAHYDNLVDPEFGYVGIGVVKVDGRIFVSETFMKLMAPAPPVAKPATAPAPASSPAPAPRPASAAPRRAPAPKPVPRPAPVPAPKPVPRPAPVPAPKPAPEPAPAAAAAPETPPPPPPAAPEPASSPVASPQTAPSTPPAPDRVPAPPLPEPLLLLASVLGRRR